MMEKRKAAVLWEIASDSTCPECLEEVRRIAGSVDIFSINLTEARNLFGTERLDEIIGNIQGMAGQFESLCTAESFADGFSAQRL